MRFYEKTTKFRHSGNEDVETYLALIHPTTDPDYDVPAMADIKVLTPEGKSIEERTFSIPARGVYFVNVDHVFDGDAQELLRPFGGLGTLKAKLMVKF